MQNTEKTNTDLHMSRINKADEFYTTYEDIEAELSLYSGAFENKTVYCPCDNENSNFFKYFKNNFEKLKLHNLIATSYNLPYSHRLEYNASDGFSKVEASSLSTDEKQCGRRLENCDFRDSYVKNIMKDADIIVTNPPFSLSKDFMLQLISLNKKFIIVGNVNAITYKGIFSQFVEGKMRLGGSIHSGDRKFFIPDDYPLEGTACGIDDEGRRYIRVKGVRWFTNVEYSYPEVKHTVLTKKYVSSCYSRYDTYDAINVNSMKEIPVDYYDNIGAPITVIDKMNKEGNLEFIDKNGSLIKFKLLGQLNGGKNFDNYDFAKPIINGKCKFKRLLIKRIK